MANNSRGTVPSVWDEKVHGPLLQAMSETELRPLGLRLRKLIDSAQVASESVFKCKTSLPVKGEGARDVQQESPRSSDPVDTVIHTTSGGSRRNDDTRNRQIEGTSDVNEFQKILSGGSCASLISVDPAIPCNQHTEVEATSHVMLVQRMQAEWAPAEDDAVLGVGGRGTINCFGAIQMPSPHEEKLLREGMRVAWEVVKNELEELKEEKALLQQQQEGMKVELEERKAELEVLKEENEQLKDENEKLKEENEKLKKENEKLKDVRSARNKRSALRKAAIAQQADWGTLHELIDAVNRSKLEMQELKQLRIEFQDQPLEEKEQTLRFLHQSQERQKALREVLLEALEKLDKLNEERAALTESLETNDLLSL